VRAAAEEEGIALDPVSLIKETPGVSLDGRVGKKTVRITGRKQMDPGAHSLPPVKSGLECVVLVDGAFAAVFHFHDAPRRESRSFVDHLSPKHRVERVLLVSGDREAEVRYLAELVGIQEIHAGKSPEEKVAIVVEEMQRGQTIFVGDGINDAPALTAATVGVAFGPNSDIASEAADAVILTASLERADELFHISGRMRSIALQSALTGMGLSMAGMILASLGYLPALAGAIAQEVIDLLVVLNAVRVAIPAGRLADMG